MKSAPDINDTHRTNGDDGVRARHDRARKFNGGASDGGNGHNTRNFGEQQQQEQKKNRFNLIPFDQIKRKAAASYLIKGVIPATGLIVVWGAPKSGKSFLAFDAVLHIALGWKYRGRRVTAGTVVYLALEGQSGFGARADAFRQHCLNPGDSVPNFYLVEERTDLIRDHAELIKCIRLQSNATPNVVVIDTMNRSLVGSESKDEDMAQYIKAADAIREAFNCAVIIIHHCGIDGTRPRGHTSLTGAADVQISVKRDAADNIVAEIEYAKDMPQGAVITSRLIVKELGPDQDGDQVTSCALEEVEDAEAVQKATTKPKPTITKGAKIALRALQEALAECGEVFASSRAPNNTKTISEKKWREYAYKRGIAVGGDRAKQKAFKAATQWLVSSSIVATWEDQYWVVREEI
jgi:hypothetical protein